MTVDERLRTAMRAHDAEAPTRVPWPAPATRAPRTRRPSGRFVLATALVAVLVAGGTWLAVAWPRTARTATPAVPVAPLACPADRDPTDESYGVPAPATVPGAADRLVPSTTPDAVVVCGYVLSGSPGSSTAPLPLTGSAVLAGDLRPVADALADLPRAPDTGVCATYLGPDDGDEYLVGLSYPGGTLWVSAPGNHCAGASNGAFTTSTNLHTVVAAWLAAGRWRPAGPG